MLTFVNTSSSIFGYLKNCYHHPKKMEDGSSFEEDGTLEPIFLLVFIAISSLGTNEFLVLGRGGTLFMLTFVNLLKYII